MYHCLYMEDREQLEGILPFHRGAGKTGVSALWFRSTRLVPRMQNCLLPACLELCQQHGESWGFGLVPQGVWARLLSPVSCVFPR